MRILARASVAGLSVLSLAAPVVGQSPTLERVEELARMGRAEEARVELMDWWEGPREDATQRDLQLGLWMRGLLTVDPAQAELDFQRLVVLYPSSPYTPEALFRLAQLGHVQGDGDAARRHIATLARDYPSSPTRSEAEAWLAGAGVSAAGAAPSASRGGAGAATTAQASRSDVTTTPDDAPLIWFVQFGAFADEERAFALHEELVTTGLAARLVSVEGSAFLHVRIGRFATRAEADTQLQQVGARGYTASIVRDDRAETVVRR